MNKALSWTYARRFMALCLLLVGLDGGRTAAADPTPAAESMFGVYAANRTAGRASLVTDDLFSVAYAELAQRRFMELERSTGQSALTTLLERLAAGVAALPSASGDDRAADSREFARDFVAVLQAAAGMDGLSLSPRAVQELALVMAASGVARSPLNGYVIDYTRFVPRGAYAEDPLLAQYFRAASYGSGVLFHFVPSHATGIDSIAADAGYQRAALIAQLIHADPVASAAVDQYAQLVTDWVGKAEDVPTSALIDAGSSGATTAATREELRERVRASDTLPRLNAEVVDARSLEPGLSVREAVMGWRLFPSAYTAESGALQQLVAGPDTAPLPCAGATVSILCGIGKDSVKTLPSLGELLAVEAPGNGVKIRNLRLQTIGGYARVTARAREELARARGPAEARWEVVGALLRRSDPAVRNSNFETAAAFWTLERHRDVLHVKQSTSPTLKAFRSSRGSRLQVDTATLLALRRLCALQAQHDAAPDWTAFIDVIDQALAAARRQRLLGTPAPGDGPFVDAIDERLRNLAGVGDRPIVVDVHTDGDGKRVLYEAIGIPHPVTLDANVIDGPVGARLHQVEFFAPLGQRWTDERWRARLASPGAPHSEVMTLIPWTEAAADAR